MKNKVCVLLFVLLSGSLYSQSLDVRLLHQIYTPHPLKADKFFIFVDKYTFSAVVATPFVMGAFGLIDRDSTIFRKALVTMTATVLTVGVTTAIKYTVNRKRPDESNIGVVDKSNFQGPSFPSGHTSSVFSTATSLSLTFPKWYVYVPTYTVAFGVAFSRVYLGGHYPSDVLAGAIVGSGCAFLTHIVNEKLIASSARKHQIKSASLYPYQ